MCEIIYLKVEKKITHRTKSKVMSYDKYILQFE